ncbi:MAG: ribonuclease III [Oscillospiraceae bacterium]|jgi:ribonuclease-3 family protein|nr:ribonuclease III [Oscillospiraceae bacterium]MEE3460253.1 ribonuclease III domain-containing protein [Candidatus Faecousia sp.]MBQ2203374.1 ribonuclease III [Oscillospiraceae bacterium]MBQ5468368.1 ribonuclease III [Oscillospiraceae bacterium]MBQ6281614.1 ribonuclease III [Oscillospiraceae bacterium]
MSDLNLTLSPEALKSVSELALAHVGDAVFELLVRQELCCVKAAPMRDLHRMTVARVNAPAQAARMEKLLPLLTPEELTVYKRGRNAHTHQAPKSASPGQYARATGLEALFGWLWLTGQIDRIAVLFAAGKEDADAT